jgi:alanine racemase
MLTHFASAEDPNENTFTSLQIERFEKACEAFIAAGHKPELFDLANSPGAIAHPESRRNMVRLGGALYGLIDDILPSGTSRPELKPVLSLSSRIAYLRQVPAGESLGYGRTFMTKRDSVIALIPIGYADGYPRGLSNSGKVYVNGHIVPITGRISMDWTMLDVTDIPGVSVGDEVFLIGGSESHAIKASDLARVLGTIGYEITCGISPRVPRVLIGS